MPMWPVYLIVAYLFYHYGLPSVAVLRGLRRTAAEFRRLDSKRFRVIPSAVLDGSSYRHAYGVGTSLTPDPAQARCWADYVVVSTYGIFAFNILNLRRGWSSLHGSENERVWRHTLLSRIYLPIVGNSGLEEVREVDNPLCASREFLNLLTEKLSLSKRKDVMIPGAVIVPKLAGATIQREPGSNAVIVYPNRIAQVLNGYDCEALSPDEMDCIYDRIVQLSKGTQSALRRKDNAQQVSSNASE